MPLAANCPGCGWPHAFPDSSKIDRPLQCKSCQAEFIPAENLKSTRPATAAKKASGDPGLGEQFVDVLKFAFFYLTLVAILAVGLFAIVWGGSVLHQIFGAVIMLIGTVFGSTCWIVGELRKLRK